MKRKLLGTSHGAKYSYWLDADLYVYQFNEVTREWIGWLCALPSWESVFSRSSWITAKVPR